MTAKPGAPAARRERITIDRTYDGAAIADVWEMWTTKDGIEAWWGPEGFAVTVRSIDLAVDGVMAYTMRATDAGQIEFMKKAGMPLATDHQMKYTEVSPPRRLAFSHYADFIPGVEPYEITHLVELHEVAGGVRVTVAIDRMHDDYWTEMAVKGWTSQMQKLEKSLAR
jgi:uncharacterized protein YndB with AHSA1/START domain